MSRRLTKAARAVLSADLCRELERIAADGAPGYIGVNGPDAAVYDKLAKEGVLWEPEPDASLWSMAPEHPAARAVYDEQGRSLSLGLSEAELRLECVRLIALGHICKGNAPMPVDRAVTLAGTLAAFVLGTNQDSPASDGATDNGGAQQSQVFGREAFDRAGIANTATTAKPPRPPLDPEVQAAIQGWSRVGFASLQSALKARHMTVNIVTGADGSWILDIGGPVMGSHRSTTISGRYPHEQVSNVLAALADRWPAFDIPESPAS